MEASSLRKQARSALRRALFSLVLMFAGGTAAVLAHMYPEIFLCDPAWFLGVTFLVAGCKEPFDYAFDSSERHDEEANIFVSFLGGIGWFRSLFLNIILASFFSFINAPFSMFKGLWVYVRARRVLQAYEESGASAVRGGHLDGGLSRVQGKGRGKDMDLVLTPENARVRGIRAAAPMRGVSAIEYARPRPGTKA